MYCLKCGKDTTGEQVFCNACLEGMDRYPVKPDTAVNLPRRPDAAVAKKQAGRKRPQSPEDQVVHLRKLVRRLALLAAVLTILLGLAAAILLKEQLSGPDGLRIGQNYTIDIALDP